MPFIGTASPGSQRVAGMTTGKDRSTTVLAQGIEVLPDLTAIGLPRLTLSVRQTVGADFPFIEVQILQKREWRVIDSYQMPALNTTIRTEYAFTCRRWRVVIDNTAGAGAVTVETIQSSIGGGT